MDRLKDLKINAWKNIALAAGVDEKPEDIHIAILYHDHGDDFLFIQTKDGHQYEYGFWCNLKHHKNYEDLLPVDEDPEKEFIRNPFLVVNRLDDDAKVSNKLLRALGEALDGPRRSYGFDYVTDVPSYAQWRFEQALAAFDDAWGSKVFYDYSSKKAGIQDFLKHNNIDTPENLQLLDNAHLSSKVDGIDGVAGKKAVNETCLSGDGVKFVIVDGQDRIKDLVYTESDWDEWGFPTKYLPLDQFSNDAKTKYINSINGYFEELDKLREVVRDGKLTLQELVDIDDAFSEILWRFPDVKEEDNE